MINDWRYRRKAMQSWEDSREQTKEEIKNDVERIVSKLLSWGRYFHQRIVLMLHKERHQ